MSTEWVEDHARAMKWAVEHPRDQGAPPHWMRCDYFRSGQHCIKGDGHSGDHEPPREN